MSRQQTEGERLQKFLANRGIASRRTIETWITEGRIKVDGRTAKLGDKVTENSRIIVNGRALRSGPAKQKTRVLLYNKPEGEISTRKDPENRPTVFKRLPKIKGGRWIVVGRLDLNSRGLLLFTNNGQLANQLMHPASELEREYMCRIFGKVEDQMIQTLLDGVELDGEVTRFRSVEFYRGEGLNSWYSVVVKEGKYREVRRLWDSVGCKVNRLIRVRYGRLTLPKSLRMGHYVELSEKEISALWPKNFKGELKSETNADMSPILPSTKKQSRSKRGK